MRDHARRIGRRFTLRQVSTFMGILGIAGIAAVTAGIAVNQRALLFQEAQDHAAQSAAFLADHAARLFEVSDIVLHATERSVAGLSWPEIDRSQAVREGMRRMGEMLPYVDTVFLADAQGRVRVTTIENAPVDYSVADRLVFRKAAKDSDSRLLIGDPIIGRVSHRPTFIVARRRNTPDGSFDGIVGASMSLSYFTDYWRTLDKRNDEQIALVRSDDGVVLVCYPDGSAAGDQRSPVMRPPGAPVIRHPGDEWRPGGDEAGAYRSVGELPVYVAVVFRNAVIAQQWRAFVWRLIPLAIVASLVLLGITALAQRLARREEVARRQIETARGVLRADNARLEAHVAQRTAALSESNREIQRFAYVVSHDLRAPLVNIMGFTSELQALRGELLGDTPAGEGSARERLRAEFDEAIGFIESSIDKMDRLIKAILSLSRQGQRAFRPEVLDMNALMRSVADGAAHQLGAKGATLTVEQLPAITADRIAVEQIFANLVDNAVKYLRNDVAGAIVIRGSTSAAMAKFEVIDNGRGIAPQDLERVFELFRRAGRQDQPGEGIGLAHVRSLVRRLKGTITLDSSEGQGSVFVVTLPLTADDLGDQ